MQFQKFEDLLQAKYPDAKAMQTKQGIDVSYQLNGRVYSHKGTIEGIAERMKLVEVWYVYRNGEVCGKAHSETEADEILTRERERDAAVAAAWNVSPSAFTIGRVS